MGVEGLLRIAHGVKIAEARGVAFGIGGRGQAVQVVVGRALFEGQLALGIMDFGAFNVAVVIKAI